MKSKVLHTPTFLLCLFFLFALHGQAQAPKPVKWNFTVKKISDKEAELVFTADIGKGYHVYSQDLNPDAGPIPTTFVFTPDKNYAVDGKVTESKSIEIFDANFGVNLKYFTGIATFVQKIKLNGTKPFKVSGTVTFMVCDDTRCYPPEDVTFSFDVNAAVKEGAKPESGPKVN
jgi:hypothetical protein